MIFLFNWSLTSLWNQNIQDNLIAGVILLLVAFFSSLLYKKIFPQSYTKIYNWFRSTIHRNYSFTFDSEGNHEDIWWEKIFVLNKFRYEIDIIPVKTYYWRLGFRLSKDKLFPPLNRLRHENNYYPDLHLGVGDRIPTEPYKKRELITFVTYHLGDQNILTDFKENYQTDFKVKLIIQFNKNTNKTEICYSYDNWHIPVSPLNLTKYKYFKFFGWADGLPYHLKIKVKKFYFY